MQEDINNFGVPNCGLNLLFQMEVLMLLHPRLKLKCLSGITYLMQVLMLMRNCTEVSADEILTCKPCSESKVLLLEAGEDSKQGSEMKILVTMKMSGLCSFDDDDEEDVETWTVFPL
jgi:hypothetical protein